MNSGNLHLFSVVKILKTTRTIFAVFNTVVKQLVMKILHIPDGTLFMEFPESAVSAALHGMKMVVVIS